MGRDPPGTVIESGFHYPGEEMEQEQRGEQQQPTSAPPSPVQSGTTTTTRVTTIISPPRKKTVGKETPKKVSMAMKHKISSLPPPLHSTMGHTSNTATGGSIKSEEDDPNVIRAPNERDILFGRGGESNNFKGNHRYQKVIEEASREYVALTSRKSKTQLAWQIYVQLRKEGARFLKRGKGSQYWSEAPQEDCRKKISQRLRERALEARDKQEMDKDAASSLLFLAKSHKLEP